MNALSRGRRMGAIVTKCDTLVPTRHNRATTPMYRSDQEVARDRFLLPLLDRAASSRLASIEGIVAMKKLTLGLSLAALAAAGVGTAYAASGQFGGSMTRAEAQAHAAQLFAKFDVNHDGKIDAADRVAREAARFDKLDTDHNGSLSRAEFMAGADHFGGREGGRHGHGWKGHHRDLGAMATMADTNHDGALTQAEFTAAALQRFGTMDTNHDGTVTREERQAARQAMHRDWQGRSATPHDPS